MSFLVFLVVAFYYFGRAAIQNIVPPFFRR